MYIKLMCFIYSDYNNIAAVFGVIIGSATDILVMYIAKAPGHNIGLLKT